MIVDAELDVPWRDTGMQTARGDPPEEGVCMITISASALVLLNACREGE